jgi:alpha-glucosidase
MDEWWRGAVVYEIYPRSFRDGDGDGVGDLSGITAGLEHVADLGVDAVWIAPFYSSPMTDYGYDVSDYVGVDPRFGTLADVDALLAKAHRLGLKVLIDQVWSHSSDRHPWFLDSAENGAKADWYIWADAKPDGSPPNNWLSVFGGPAWRWDPRRRQYYLHHFLSTQPKLNLRHPAVMAALLEAGAFWLDRGVDGFRLDAVDFMVHDPLLRDNPPREPPGGIMPLRPFGLQHHRHDMAHPDTAAVLRQIRGLMARFPGTTTVAEVSSEDDALQRCHAYTGGNESLHMAYTLRLMKGEFGAAAFRAALEAVESRFDDGWLCWAFSNHDVPRVVGRWGDGSPGFAKLAMALLLCLRGSVCLYQGEELGLADAELRFEDLHDPYGINFWPRFKGRDGCRTPMPWSATAPQAGFTSGRPWLPLPAEHAATAVDRQEADPDSVLAYTRRLLAWRKAHPALRLGRLDMLPPDGDLLGFERRRGDQRVRCLFNLGQEDRAVTLPEGWQAVEELCLAWDGATLGGWGAVMMVGDQPALRR